MNTALFARGSIQVWRENDEAADILVRFSDGEIRALGSFTNEDLRDLIWCAQTALEEK